MTTKTPAIEDTRSVDRQRLPLFIALLAAIATALSISPAVALDTGEASDPVVVRDATWYRRDDLSGGAANETFGFGRSGDVPVTGDWDGSGTRTPGVFRDGFWYLDDDRLGGAAALAVGFGRAGDVPVVGDWNGDGRDGIGVVRGNIWYLDVDLDGRNERRFAYGRTSDVPLAGDWDGDGTATPGVRRDALFILANTADGRGPAAHLFGFGRPQDVPIVGRWVPGQADRVGVIRGATWFLRERLSGGAADRAFRYGRGEDLAFVRRATPTEEGAEPADVTYRYWIGALGGPQGSLSTFANAARRALTDDRGWSLDGAIAFERTSSRGSADFELWLTDAEDVGDQAPVCSDAYSCRVGDDLFINDENFASATPTWRSRPLDQYRRYVINHEVGHWLGLGHYNDAGRCLDGRAPVMMQQSISLYGCATNLWPLPFERSIVRSIHLG